MGFGETLRARRLALGLTQEALGAMIGRSKNSVSQLELGKREPDMRLLCKLSRTLCVTCDELIGAESRLPAEIARRVPVRAAPVGRDALYYRYTDAPEDARCGLVYIIADFDLPHERIRKGDLLLLRTGCANLPSGALVALHDGTLSRCPVKMEDTRQVAGRVVRVEFEPEQA